MTLSHNVIGRKAGRQVLQSVNTEGVMGDPIPWDSLFAPPHVSHTQR